MSAEAPFAGAEQTRRLPAGWKLGVLAALYFVQGLPFGFQSKGLKLALTALGVSMAKVTLTGLLSLPWLLKPLIAPFVDRHGSARFGRRKSWVVPLQLLLASTFVIAAFEPPDVYLSALLVTVFFMNLFAATQDVPVDGLAVDLLAPNELGAGNAVQVVGYKIGMLVGGSILVSQIPRFGWRAVFFAMAAMCLVVTFVVLFVKEPSGSHLEPGARHERLSWREFAVRLRAMVDTQGAFWLLAFVAFYKAGESMADALFEPFLLREGHFAIEKVAQFSGWAMGGSLFGSLAGGVLATRMSFVRAVGWAAVFRAVPLFGMWCLVTGLIAMSSPNVIVITTAEHFFGGLITTPMFALMMSRVDKRVGATQFTLLAAVEVLGKSPFGLAAGTLSDTIGWGPTFLFAVGLSVAFLLLLIPMARRGARPSDEFAR